MIGLTKGGLNSKLHAVPPLGTLLCNTLPGNEGFGPPDLDVPERRKLQRRRRRTGPSVVSPEDQVAAGGSRLRRRLVP